MIKNTFRRVTNKLPMIYVGSIIDSHENLIHQGNIKEMILGFWGTVRERGQFLEWIFFLE
jgi:hypothetical protein